MNNVYSFSFYPMDDMGFSDDVYRVDVSTSYLPGFLSSTSTAVLDFITVRILIRDPYDLNDNEFTYRSDEFVLKAKDIDKRLLKNDGFLYHSGSADNNFFKPCLINNLWPVGQEDPLKENVISALKAGIVAFDTLTTDIVWVSPKHSKILNTEGVTAFHNHLSSNSQAKQFFDSNQKAQDFFMDSFKLNDIQIRDYTPEQEIASYLFDCAHEALFIQSNNFQR